MAGFRSERWPASSWNGGRLQIGIGGRLRRNMQLRYTHVDGLHIDAATEAPSDDFPGMDTQELPVAPSGEAEKVA